MKIKKTLDPSQLTIVCDTREQRPIDVSPLKMIRGTLPTGDYAIKNLEHYAVCERKSLSDLMGCIGQDRERFEREVMRLLAYPVRALVVEASWSDIEQHRYRSKVTPAAAIGSILGWIAQGLPVLMVDNHESAGRYISRILFTAARRRWLESYDFIESVVDPVEENKNAS